VRASGLDASKLSGGLTTSNSSLLGPKPNLGGASLTSSSPSLGTPLASSRPKLNLDDVELKSGVSAGLVLGAIGCCLLAGFCGALR